MNTANYIVNYTPRTKDTRTIRGYILRHGQLGDDTDKVEFDATVSESHIHVAKVTTHPVEQGVAVSDFTRPEPIQLRIEGVITNHPISLPGTQVSGIREVKKTFKWRGDSKVLGATINGPGLLGGIGKAVGREVGLDQRQSSALGYSAEFFRVEHAYEILSTIVESGEAVQIVTTLASYDDMVIESFAPTRDVNTGNSLKFTIDARQIRIVTTRSVDAPKTDLKQAKTINKLANQAPKEVPPEEQEPADSMAAKVLL